jgi:hypothetical protein
VDLDLVRQLAVPNDTKILLAVVDGLGGLPHPDRWIDYGKRR